MMCEYCGAQVFEDQEFCRNCGASIQGSILALQKFHGTYRDPKEDQSSFKTQNENREPKKSNVNLVVLTIVIMLIVGIGASLSIFSGIGQSIPAMPMFQNNTNQSTGINTTYPTIGSINTTNTQQSNQVAFTSPNQQNQTVVSTNNTNPSYNNGTNFLTNTTTS